MPVEVNHYVPALLVKIEAPNTVHPDEVIAATLFGRGKSMTITKPGIIELDKTGYSLITKTGQYELEAAILRGGVVQTTFDRNSPPFMLGQFERGSGSDVFYFSLIYLIKYME